MSRKETIICLAGIGLFMGSCNSAVDGSLSAHYIVDDGRGGDFRGINFGDYPDKVKEVEGVNTVYSMPDELVYRLPLNSGDSIWYEISYSFSDAGLYEIHMEIMARQEQVLSGLYEEIRELYARKYGKGRITDRSSLWRVMVTNGHVVNIIVGPSVTTRNQPCIRIQFYESRS
jgi:hypothetical protein